MWSRLFAEEGHIICYLRDGDRVFLTYSTTGRGNEPVDGSLGLLDMTPYGRREAREDNPEGWPEGSHLSLVLALGSGRVATWGPTSRPVPQRLAPRDPRGDPRPARPPPLTLLRRLTKFRRLIRDYETLPATHEAMI